MGEKGSQWGHLFRDQVSARYICRAPLGCREHANPILTKHVNEVGGIMEKPHLDIYCNRLQFVLDGDEFPIFYDVVHNEFHLLGYDRQMEGYCVLRYCPFCGNSFPKSTRSGRVDFDTNLEAQQLRVLSSQIVSIEAMYEVLGEPDRIMSAICSRLSKFDPWIRMYEYKTRFNSCWFIVKEYADGSLRRLIGGKPSGQDADGSEHEV